MTADLVREHLPVILVAARLVCLNRPGLRRWLGGLEDAQQWAVLYCLRWGLRHYRPELGGVREYMGLLARRGVFDAARLMKDRESRGWHPPLLETDHAAPLDSRFDEADPVEDAVLDRLEVAQALGVLTPREREMVALFYGLGGQPPRSLLQIGELLGVSWRTVQVTLGNARKRLRSNFRVDCE